MAMNAAEQRAEHRDRSAQRREDAFARAKRHSRHVRVLKIALPTAAVVIGLGFLGFSQLSMLPEGVAFDLGSTAIRDGKLVMSNPKLAGYTKENLPYSMNAARAIQNLSRTGGIELEGIDARIPIAADTFATVLADTGVYDDVEKTLTLTSPFTLTTNDGLKAKLGGANVDIAAGEMRTTEPVTIEQDGSVITADSMQVLDKGKVFVFENRVRMTVAPRTTTADARGSTPRTGN